jgi:hypothetical protein
MPAGAAFATARRGSLEFVNPHAARPASFDVSKSRMANSRVPRAVYYLTRHSSSSVFAVSVFAGGD